MSEYVFLTDVDGTLLRTNQPVHPDVVGAAHDFTNRGGMLAICTGRTILATARLAREIGVNAPCILNSGAAIYDFNTERFLWSKRFPKGIIDIMHRIYEGFPDISLQAYAIDAVYNIRKTPFMEEVGVNEEKNVPTCTFSEMTHDIVKLGISSPDSARLQEIAEKFLDPELCESAFASRRFIEITPKGVHKGTTMEIVAAHLGIPLDHFFAAGDAMTDIPILRKAGISFAPQDAPSAVKNACTHIIPRPEDAGMHEAFTLASKIIR